MASGLILLDQVKINQLIQRCIKLVQKKPANFFHVRKLKCQGLWVPPKEDSLPISNRIHDGAYIVIDPRREFIGSLIHELIHELEPDWSEKQVLYADRRLTNRASLCLILKLLKTFTDKVYKREMQKIRRK